MRTHNHHINLKEGAQRVFGLGNIFMCKKSETQKIEKELLDSGVIPQSTSPFAFTVSCWLEKRQFMEDVYLL